MGNGTSPIGRSPALFGRVRGPIVVDLFAGAGGASEGVRRAIGYGPVVAINHCQHAIDMHRLNHPETEHYCESVFDVRPQDATRGRVVDALWCSPDCRHFSRAKGGKPVDKKIRGLAWVVVRWAAEVRPRVIMMENVSELVTWGGLARPARGGRKHLGSKAHLDADGNKVGGIRRARWDKPLPAEKGKLFALFVSHLRALGYVVEWRNLVACDYGAPTSRKRLYLVARSDGQPIVWPEPTHGPGRAKPWRTAAECIDWTIPMLSIFATPAEAKAWAKATGADGVPVRPLAEPTLARIREGIRRFVLDNPKPFIVTIDQQSTRYTADSINAPLSTSTVKARHAVVSPIIAKAHANGSDTAGSGIRSAGDPAPTFTTTEQFAVLAPMLQTLTHGQRHESIEEPMRTVTGAHRGERVIAAAHLINTRNGEREGQAPRAQSIEKPLSTVTAKGSQGAVVAAFLAQHNGGEVGNQAYGRAFDEPMQTIAGNVNKAPVAVFLDKFHGTAKAGQPVDAPAPTITGGGDRGGGHASMVAAFLSPFYGAEKDGQSPDVPLRTVPTKDRFGLVTVTIAGTEYAIVDIAMRMLQPHELAAANGWRDMKRIGTKAQQVARIGNMVVPEVAEALARANVGDCAMAAK